MAVLAYRQTEGLCKEYERSKIRKKNRLRQVLPLVSASTARWRLGDERSLGLAAAASVWVRLAALFPLSRVCLRSCLRSETGNEDPDWFFRSIQCIVCCDLNQAGVRRGTFPCNADMEESPGYSWKRGCVKTGTGERSLLLLLGAFGPLFHLHIVHERMISMKIPHIS